MAIRSKSAKSALQPNNSGRFVDPTAADVSPRRLDVRLVAKRLLLVGCFGFAATSLTGCTLGSNMCGQLCDQECIDDFILGYRNRAMAEKAWHCRKHCFCDTRYGKEFKDGFISGYIDIASGGYGCTPAIAPASYLGWRYQSAGGHQAVNAWFQGFPQGVKAAEEDGVGNWQSLRVYGQTPQPGTMPAGSAAPAEMYDQDEPELTNPFYPDEPADPEVVPVPDPEFMEPGDVDPLQVPDDFETGADESESVFDGLFPPVAVKSLDDESTSDAVIAERFEDDNSQDIDDGELPFTFE